MARTPRKHPKPNLRKRGEQYELRWFWKGKLFEIRLGKIKKSDAEVIRDATAVALAGASDFPEELKAEPALKRYLVLQAGIASESSDTTLIHMYSNHLQAQNPESQWYSIVKYHLNRALAKIGTLQNATTRELQTYLDTYAVELSGATSNRAHTALSGFYSYLRKMGHHPKTFKPLEDIAKKRETPPPDGIVIWEPSEVKKLLKAADKRRDGIAVWIAILAGLRRSEIARIRWEDISETTITVQKSKTGKKRLVPLSALLAKKLEPLRKKSGKIVPWPDAYYGWISAAKKMVEKYLPKDLSAIHKKHPEKFGWNPFRHTFASRHAQNGLSLDIISAWLGDSPKVCKEHYARYVPAKFRDTRIDAADPKL